MLVYFLEVGDKYMKNKDLILGMIIILFFGLIGCLSLNYIIKSGDCQIRAKYYKYYDDSIPIKCFKNINYLKEK